LQARDRTDCQEVSLAINLTPALCQIDFWEAFQKRNGSPIIIASWDLAPEGDLKIIGEQLRIRVGGIILTRPAVMIVSQK
jgi:hypothetical protein